MTITQHKIRAIRNLTDTTYIIRFDRNNLRFIPGQYLSLRIESSNQSREYSIYSTNKDDYLEVLIKKVEDGMLSKLLRNCKEGDYLIIDGPFGSFTIEEFKYNKSYLFIATGTGISPFHSIIGSYSNLKYKLVHGVRFESEAYEKHSYNRGKYIICSSRDKQGDIQGHVTDYILKNPVNNKTLVYLCGNHKMIYDVCDILIKQKIPSGNIKTEVYF